MPNQARLLILAALPVALAACAPTGQTAATAAVEGAAPRPERRCFQGSQVSNFRADDQTLYMKVGRRDVYQATVTGDCRDIESAFRIAVVATDGGSSLCVGDPITVAAPGQTAPAEVCRARLDRQLTAEQVAALPARLRP